MTSLFLSRVALRRDASAAALAPLLVPDGVAARTSAAHRLVWSLFADDPDRRRDFLWREERPGQWMILSSRPPQDSHGLFQLETKPFEAALAVGDRLEIALRANAVVARPAAKGERGKRHDVVMNALKDVAPGARAESRRDAVSTAGRAWLHRQGEVHGFVPAEDVVVDGYDRVTVRRDGAAPITFGVLEFSGRIMVADPQRFLAAIAQGFGRSRAFGCGLMLIRRPRRG